MGDWYDEPGTTAREVVESEPEFSGLYDAQGRKLYRLSQRGPLGFDTRRISAAAKAFMHDPARSKRARMAKGKGLT